MSAGDVISLWKKHKWTRYVTFMKNDKAFHAVARQMGFKVNTS